MGSPPTLLLLMRTLIWVENRKVAIPAVNPVTTGLGMNLIKVPNPKAPNPTRKQPDNPVQMIRPLGPNLEA